MVGGDFSVLDSPAMGCLLRIPCAFENIDVLVFLELCDLFFFALT